MNKKNSFTGIVSALFAFAVAFNLAIAAVPPPPEEGENPPENEWPEFIYRFNPLSGNLLRLEIKESTPQKAIYDVDPDLGEPDISFCRNNPTACELTRP